MTDGLVYEPIAGRTPGRRALLGGAAALLAAASLAGAGAAGARELKLTHSDDASHPNHVAAVAMAENIAERTGGGITIRIFPANELGWPPETTEQVRLPPVYRSLRVRRETGRE